MNSVTAQFLDNCHDDRELRGSVGSAVYPPVFAESYRHLLLPRPMFVPDAVVRMFADDLAEVFRLLVSLPTRIFNGDMAGYCAAVGINERLAALMTHGDTANPPLFGRSDAYYDGTQFKMLEFNVGTELGGMDFAEMNRALLDVPAFGRFADEHRLTYVDTADVVAGVLTDVARTVTDADRPVVVLLETIGGIAAHANYMSVREAMNRRGLDFRLGEVQDIRTANGKLTIEGTPVDVALRFFAAGEILDCAGGPELLEPIWRAHEDGTTVLFTGLATSLYNTKGGLAMLSDERLRGSFSAAENAVIDRVVPWTRMVASDVPDLIDYCRDHRDELMVKPCVGWGAAGTARGSDATDRTWREILATCMNHGYVVQRLVVPELEPVWDPDEPAPKDWQVNWGVFVTPAGYAGSFERALRPEDGTIISFGNKGTRGTTAFTFGADAAE